MLNSVLTTPMKLWYEKPRSVNTYAGMSVVPPEYPISSLSSALALSCGLLPFCTAPPMVPQQSGVITYWERHARHTVPFCGQMGRIPDAALPSPAQYSSPSPTSITLSAVLAMLPLLNHSIFLTADRGMSDGMRKYPSVRCLFFPASPRTCSGSASIAPPHSNSTTALWSGLSNSCQEIDCP